MVASVHLRWIAWRTAAFTNDPVPTGAEVRFIDWKVCKVRTKCVDCGLDFLELGRSRWS
jgi:hypothetical protein